MEIFTHIYLKEKFICSICISSICFYEESAVNWNRETYKYLKKNSSVINTELLTEVDALRPDNNLYSQLVN